MQKAADHPVGGCVYLFDILEFGGESPLTMRARCSAFRYCPDPLGIVTTEQLDKLEFIYLSKNGSCLLNRIYISIGRIIGNITVSRILSVPISTCNTLSIPIPQPEIGGMPYSIAVT